MEIRTVGGEVTRELRRLVLRPTWPPGSAMHGDEDPQAVHVAAFDTEAAVIGACLVLPAPFPYTPGADQWQLRGMATAPGLRGQGVGANVLAAAVREVETRGATLLWCGARTGAAAFYARHGFAAIGEQYVQEETGLPHVTMWRAVEPAPRAVPS